MDPRVGIGISANYEGGHPSLLQSKSKKASKVGKKCAVIVPDQKVLENTKKSSSKKIKTKGVNHLNKPEKEALLKIIGEMRPNQEQLNKNAEAVLELMYFMIHPNDSRIESDQIDLKTLLDKSPFQKYIQVTDVIRKPQELIVKYQDLHGIPRILHQPITSRLDREHSEKMAHIGAFATLQKEAYTMLADVVGRQHKIAHIDSPITKAFEEITASGIGQLETTLSLYNLGSTNSGALQTVGAVFRTDLGRIQQGLDIAAALNLLQTLSQINEGRNLYDKGKELEMTAKGSHNPNHKEKIQKKADKLKQEGIELIAFGIGNSISPICITASSCASLLSAQAISALQPYGPMTASAAAAGPMVAAGLGIAGAGVSTLMASIAWAKTGEDFNDAYIESEKIGKLKKRVDVILGDKNKVSYDSESQKLLNSFLKGLNIQAQHNMEKSAWNGGVAFSVMTASAFGVALGATTLAVPSAGISLLIGGGILLSIVGAGTATYAAYKRNQDHLSKIEKQQIELLITDPLKTYFGLRLEMMHRMRQIRDNNGTDSKLYKVYAMVLKNTLKMEPDEFIQEVEEAYIALQKNNPLVYQFFEYAIKRDIIDSLEEKDKAKHDISEI